MLSKELRLKFLKYFSDNNHKLTKSAPLTPQNDPSLLFVNAGMVPFKEKFLGIQEIEDKNLTSCQKCIRCGGKHNDFQNVGRTARHHSFFEMLGNFSFGGYFKEEAIALAWDFCLKQLSLEKEKLFITVHSSDQESLLLWQKHVSKDHLFIIDNEDNFWSMAKTGLCGPSTEIFYNHDKNKVMTLEDFEINDKLIEIWNIVFMQYDRDKNGKLDPIPKPCIDTGMGLERITAVLQNKPDNYQTDSFQTIIDGIKQLYDTKLENHHIDNHTEHYISHKIIADHIRSVAFLLAENIIPSNNERGYITAKLIRRAIRHLKKISNTQKSISDLIPIISKAMDYYSELTLANQEGNAIEIIEQEENDYNKLLFDSHHIFKKYTDNLKDGSSIDGELIFKLYDTHGIPLDSIEGFAEDKNLSLDIEGYKKTMAEQKKRSQSKLDKYNPNEAILEILESDNQVNITTFKGYEAHQLEQASLTKIILIKDTKQHENVKQATQGDNIIAIFDQTVFYPESGGQLYDLGEIVSSDKTAKITITNVRKLGKFIIHTGVIEKGEISTNQIFSMKVDKNRRNALSRTHTTTHILHAILKQRFGHQVSQMGSLVNVDSLRFDFSCNIDVKEIANQNSEIKKQIKEIIRQDLPVQTKEMPYDKAIEEGNLGLFSEKYDKDVRVVSILDQGDSKISSELCGGIHVKKTNDIGNFVITSLSSIGKNIKRIEALTYGEADKYEATQEATTEIKLEAHEIKPSLTSVFEKKIETLQDHSQISSLELQAALKTIKKRQEEKRQKDRADSLEYNTIRSDILQIYKTTPLILQRKNPADTIKDNLINSKDLISAIYKTTDDLIKKNYDFISKIEYISCVCNIFYSIFIPNMELNKIRETLNKLAADDSFANVIFLISSETNDRLYTIIQTHNSIRLPITTNNSLDANNQHDKQVFAFTSKILKRYIQKQEPPTNRVYEMLQNITSNIVSHSSERENPIIFKGNYGNLFTSSNIESNNGSSKQKLIYQAFEAIHTAITADFINKLVSKGAYDKKIKDDYPEFQIQDLEDYESLFKE